MKLLNIIYKHRWLILIILLAYAPLMGFRLIRTTGDEKVYIAQAFEMKEAGNWFLQILGGRPDYYKGPLHYLFLLFGLKTIGLSLWTALYMNLLFCLAGAVALAEIVSETFSTKKAWPFWAGCFFAFNCGIYGHFFASQMEVELAGLFSLAFYFLWRGRTRDELIFWILAGTAGWIKSPLHSVLLGSSALLFWIIEGTFAKHVLNRKSLACAFTGVVICALGYAPAFLLDRANFTAFYLYRENLSKPANGGPWWQSLLSITTYYLIPWMSVAVLSYVECVVNLLRGRLAFKRLSDAEKRLWKLSLSTAAVTIGFFCYHPYRGENYAMPITASMVLLILLGGQHTSGVLLRFRKKIFALTSVFIILVAIGFQILAYRFEFPPGVWPTGLLPFVWAIGLACFGFRVRDYFVTKTDQNADGFSIGHALSNVGFVSLVGILLALLGEMEIQPVKQQVQQFNSQLSPIASVAKQPQVWYWNLNRLIWNEWGLTSLAVHYPIRPLLEQEQILLAAKNGDLILARDTDRGKEMIEYVSQYLPDLKPVTYEWNRWKTHAEDEAGHSLVHVAWAKKDLSVLFDKALILRFE